MNIKEVETHLQLANLNFKRSSFHLITHTLVYRQLPGGSRITAAMNWTVLHALVL